MAKLLRMPEVAAGATTVVLAEWAIAEDTSFDVDDPIVVIETDKASVDFEAEYPGVLLKALVLPGTEVEVGAPIAVIADLGEKIDDIPALLAILGVRGPSVGGAESESEMYTAATSQLLPSTADGDAAGSNALSTPNSRIFASPLARRLAAETGLDLANLLGTGPNGRIVRRDIEALQQKPQDFVSAPNASLDLAATAPSDYVDEPHTKLRRIVAARLTESKQTQPHFYVTGTARVDALLATRAQLNEISPSKISVNDMLIKAMAKAHQLVPQMNTIWTPDAIRTFPRVDIAVAIASERGLLTPVLRGVDTLSISEIADATKSFVDRAQAGKIKQSELEGGSTTISNLGMLGVDEFSAIINPPQSSILAVGTAKAQPIVVDGRVEVASVLRVVLSVDHRPIDGAVAAQWMSRFISLLENPIRIFA